MCVCRLAEPGVDIDVDCNAYEHVDVHEYDYVYLDPYVYMYVHTII